jgi:putative DNA primase/helicase
MSANQAVDDFRAALRAHGIEPPEDLQADGRLHRCDVDSHNGKGDATYVLHLDGIPAGGFQNWQNGSGWIKWCSKRSKELTPAERAQLRERAKRVYAEREAEERLHHQDAAVRARRIWGDASKALADHPYLARKGVESHGLKLYSGPPLVIGGMACEGALIVPLRDSSGQIRNLEFIASSGDKRFLPGGEKSGNYFSMGKPHGVLTVVEGFATGASVHEATGHAVAVAFGAGNLAAVAKVLRAKLPDIRLVLAADNDLGKEANVGLEAARRAARAVNGLVAVPELNGAKCDFNDVAQARGAQAVNAAIDAAERSDMDLRQKSAPEPIVSLVQASAIPMQAVRWLWKGWLAAGKFHVLAGVPGTGKTTIALSVAATVTTGGRWPDESQCPQPGNVLIWSGEDGTADTLVPRLKAMGADLARVHFIEGVSYRRRRRPFDPSVDMRSLVDAARKLGDVQLLIVDPVVVTVSGDSHKNAEVRRSLAPLVDFSHALGAAVLGISHFSKGTAGKEPLDRVTGSLAFGALARIVLGAATRKSDVGDDGSVLVRIKSNIGASGGAIAYSLQVKELASGVVGTSIIWGEPIKGSAGEILADVEQAADTHAKERSARDDAQEFLLDILKNGALPTKQLLKDAGEAGHTRMTLRRAKQRLGVRARKNGMGGGWCWELPSNAQNGSAKTFHSPEGTQEPEVSTFDNRDHLQEPGDQPGADVEVF